MAYLGGYSGGYSDDTSKGKAPPGRGKAKTTTRSNVRISNKGGSRAEIS